MKIIQLDGIITLNPFIKYYVVGWCLKCYNDGEEQIVKCDENLGYRTCFIRYNESKNCI